ncbi:MAG TPA: molybdopterin-dependent oxidoreductase [Candidatus Acidoferrales bacterium]|nr:molybdopterin-dependent oxidoreductase [Candidatus Acidoferrales bacterium]
MPALSRSTSLGRAAAAGAVAGAAGVGASELIAGIVPGAPSLVVAVGSLVIALQPPGAKDVMTTLFGTNDKTALNVAVVAVALLVGAVAGILGRRSFGTAWRILLGFGFAALVAAVVQPLNSAPLAAVSAVVATAVGVVTLRVLLADAGFLRPMVLRRAAVAPPDPVASMPDWNRRRFLLRSGGFLGGAVVAGAFGRVLLERQHPSGAPVSATLPVPTEVAQPLVAGDSLAAPGITPIVTPNDQFYRIDTELLVPQVDASTWQLRVTGMVDHPLTFTYDELLALPLFEQYVTLSCVSNDVGGNLISNTLWTGVHLKQVLAEAGVHAAATQIVGRSVDGFTVGFPTAWALDPAREPMIAVGMNRVPLPAEHGYPARLIVPGLYGYVSATKWLSEIELTTREAFDAYWIQLGWAKDGPILTQSRIDHPAGGASVAAGPVDVDGVAWAPDRGVGRVEVRVDNGPWQAAMLSRAISKATWVQWVYRWQATSGSHTIQVRATDGTGTVQTATPGGPSPAGATGYDQVQVTVA